MKHKIERLENLWMPLTMILLLLASALAFVNVGFASPDATFKVVPTNSVGRLGETFTVSVYGYDLVDVYAWQVYMEWPQANLDATDVVIAGFLGNLPSTRIQNAADPSFIIAGESLEGDVPGKDAAVAVLCTMTFVVQVETSTTLDISGFLPPDMYLTFYQKKIDYPLKHIPITENGYYIGAPWPEDINGDGWVDIFDLSSVAIHFGETGSPGWIPEDLSGPGGEPDGVIDVWDLTAVCLKYGQYAG